MASSTSGMDNTIAAGVTTLGNAAVAAASNRRQFKNQMKAMEAQMAQNKQLWDYQNAYNTPQQQMARLQAAGLNPNLIYGSGAGGMGQASPIQSAEVPTMQAIKPEIGNPMMNYLQARQMDAQYAATVQSTEVMRSRAGLTDMQTALAGLKNMQEHARSKNFNALAQSEERIAAWTARKAQQLMFNEQSKGSLLNQLYDVRQKQITGIDLDNTFKTYRNKLAQLGIYSTDDPKLRLLIQGAHRMGIDLGEMMATSAKDLIEYIK